HFEIKQVKMTDGKIFYTDNTLNRPFSYIVKDINLTANNISENSKNLSSQFSMTSGEKGKIVGEMVLDMTNTYNVKYTSSFKNIDMLSFSPYSEYFIASPITQGIFNYDISLDMTETSLVNENGFDIKELEFGKKIKSDSAYKVPVKLALMLMKDKNDNIQFDVPITGNPSEPDFKIMPLVWKTLGKFFAKAATSPMRAMSSLAGKNAEDLEFLPFEYGQSSFTTDQKTLLNKIIEFHEQKPALLFTFIQMTNREEEKDAIAILEAKKKFDAANWQTISDKDVDFKTFLVAQSGLEETAPIEKMARKVIGENALSTKLSGLISARNTALSNHFSSVENAAEVFKIETADLANLPAELRKPQYKIEVGVE
ncbi:MAG TPA: DUF748 domain-containing protein, partial [Crocinitomicaceae bacterium]|nr:DUF748 domain-containing protein [Crocinitomicaceae bacterium]